MIENVTEKVIEDIFSTDKSILAGILSVNQSDLSQLRDRKNLTTKESLICFICVRMN
jgi:hypothetical protein